VVVQAQVLDGQVGTGGGTVVDTAGTGAAFSVQPGILPTQTDVFVELISQPGVSPPPGFLGVATALVNITLEPNPSPLPAPGATITLPLAIPLASGTPLILFKYDPATGTLVDTGKVGLVDTSGTTATFSGVTEFSTFVGASGVKNINNLLSLVKTKLTYNPRPVDNAPAGVFTISSTFKNKSSATLKDLFFKVKILTGGNVVLNADGGPAGVGAVISVPAGALGDNGTLEPNETFTIAFKIGLKKHWPFLFFVDGYGVPLSEVTGLAVLEAEDGFQFDVTEEQLATGSGLKIYLPIIVK
jgi:hypothetical protein